MSREVDKYSLDTRSTSLARTCTQVHWHAHVPRYYMYSSCARNIRQLWCITISSLESCDTSVTQPNPIYPQIPVPAVFKVHVFFTILFFTILFLRILIITTVIHVPAQPPQCPLSTRLFYYSLPAALVILQIQQRSSRI